LDLIFFDSPLASLKGKPITHLEVEGLLGLGFAHSLLAGAEGPEVLGSLGHIIRVELKDDSPVVLAADTAQREKFHLLFSSWDIIQLCQSQHGKEIPPSVAWWLVGGLCEMDPEISRQSTWQICARQMCLLSHPCTLHDPSASPTQMECKLMHWQGG
jgi:hypothetical protein